jgi:hypothetical protein
MSAVKNKTTKKITTPTRDAVKTKQPTSANSIRYRIMTRLEGTNEVYEATAEIPGFKPTKVLRSDGGTVFTTRSALTKACRDRATALKRLSVFDLGTPATKSAPKSKKVASFSSSGNVCPVTGASA